MNYCEYVYSTPWECYTQGAWDLMMTRAQDGHYTDRAFYFDTIFQIQDAAKPFNLYSAAYKKPDRRWQKFARDYIDLPSFDDWLSQVIEEDSQKLSKSLTYVFKEADHKLGNCVLSLSARVIHRQPIHLTLVSRMSEWFPVAPLDLNLIAATAHWLKSMSLKEGPVTATWIVQHISINRYKALYLKSFLDWEYVEHPGVVPEYMAYWQHAEKKFPTMRNGGFSTYRVLGSAVDRARTPAWRAQTYIPSLLDLR